MDNSTPAKWTSPASASINADGFSTTDTTCSTAPAGFKTSGGDDPAGGGNLGSDEGEESDVGCDHGECDDEDGCFDDVKGKWAEGWGDGVHGDWFPSLGEMQFQWRLLF
jgi:hypothetical protein